MTSPNPVVGAVVVKSGKIVGEGFHKHAGSDHAEIIALRKAGYRAKGATLFVTLEPCCHHGLTGPCTTAIIDAGVKRVVYAIADPDKRVTHKGAQTLKRAGVAVTANVLDEEAKKLNEPHFHFNATGRPLVTLKLAQSLDGCIATKSGDSKWISGAESRKFVHTLRSKVDAVIIGAQTARQDDPQLTVRLTKGRNPFRVVAVSSGVLSKNLKLFRNNKDLKTIVACSRHLMKQLGRQLRNQNIIFWEIESKDGELDLKDLLQKAGVFGFRHVLVEGGSGLATSLLRDRLIDKYVAVVSPRIIGDGLRVFSDVGVRAISESVGGKVESVTRMGNDIVVEMMVGSPIKPKNNRKGNRK